MMKKKHPLEYLVADSRINESPYHGMDEHSMLLTNFPRNQQISQTFIRDLILKAEPTAVLTEINIREAMRGDQSDSIVPGTAYVTVKF